MVKLLEFVRVNGPGLTMLGVTATIKIKLMIVTYFVYCDDKKSIIVWTDLVLI